MKLKTLLLANFKSIPRGPNKKLEIYKCKYCTTEYAFHVTRMTKHLVDNCRGCPEELKTAIKNKQKRRSHCTEKENYNSLRKRKREDSFSSDSADEETTKNSIVVTNSGQKIITFIDKISPKDQECISKALAKAIYVSGCPLSLMENQYWQIFIHMLRPTFNIPSRYLLSNDLLNKTYDSVKKDVDIKIASSKTLAVQLNAWSNIRNEGIVNFIINTPEPVFYQSVETKTDSQNAEFYLRETSRVIDELDATKVIGVITDNASVCQKLWKLLEIKYAEHFITGYGCAAHVLNLIVKDIANLKIVSDLLKKCSALVKEIKQSHLLSAKFKEIQNSVEGPEKVTITLKFPAATRWGSQLYCLESIQKNKHNLQTLAISSVGTERLVKVTREQLLSLEYWIQIDKTIKLLELVCTWIKNVDKDDSVISDLCQMFHDLEHHFQKELVENNLSLLNQEETTNVLNQLKERKKLLLKPVHYAASILDPKYKGSNLSSIEFESGQIYITDLALKFGLDKNLVLVDLMEYQAGEGMWKANHIKIAAEIGKPITWWKGMCSKSAICEIAIAVLQLPCTSSATERSFSSYGWIHDSKRNSLGNSNASKITYISYNTKLFDREPKVSSFREKYEEAELANLLSLGDLEDSFDNSLNLNEVTDDFIENLPNLRNDFPPNIVCDNSLREENANALQQRSLSNINIDELPIYIRDKDNNDVLFTESI